MAEYAFLISRPNKVMLFLGKAVKKPGGEVDYFSAEDGHGGCNSRNNLLTQALWKFIADFGFSGIEIVREFDPDFESISRYREIGGDTIDDVSLEQYVADWRG
jgi:hypothetical protein